jgi:hypothetical protein
MAKDITPKDPKAENAEEPSDENKAEDRSAMRLTEKKMHRKSSRLLH